MIYDNTSPVMPGLDPGIQSGLMGRNWKTGLSPVMTLLLGFMLLAAPAAAHENPYTMLTLEVSQSDIPQVRVGYTAILTEDALFGLAEGQRLPVFFLKTDAEPRPGMFSDEEMAALCRKYVPYTVKKARRGADHEFGIGALRYNDDGTATRDVLAVWTFDDPCTVDD